MAWTKRQFVLQAFEEVGYASYAYDLQPEQLQAGMRRLDSMIATWNAKGIRLGYPIPSSPENGDLDDETNVPDSANEAIYINLALRIAALVGKMVSPDTKVAAKMAYDAMSLSFAVPPERQLPGDMPSGAGNKPWRWDDEYLRDPVDPLLAGGDGEIEFN